MGGWIQTWEENFWWWSGQRPSSWTDDALAEVNALIKENRWITVNKPCADEYLPVMMKLQMWCLCAFRHNQNFFCRWDQKTCAPLHSMHWKKRGEYIEKWYPLHLYFASYIWLKKVRFSFIYGRNCILVFIDP